MINTKLLLRISSVLLGVLGLTITFLPAEFIVLLKFTPNDKFNIIVQLLGTAYFALAMLNWTAKDNVIAGSYGRPVAIGNFAHFFIGGLVLTKASIIENGLGLIFIAAIIYILFAALFGIIVFQKSKKRKIFTKK